jgi:hypothetical protein
VNRCAYARGNPVSLKDATGTFAAPPAEKPPLTQADLTTKSDEEIRAHPTYFDEGIASITYYGEDKQATVEYEGGETLTIDTSDIRTQPRSTITPGTVAFGVKPEDLNEPEVEAAYTIDEPSGRIVPGEINVENAPNFTALLKEGRRQFDTGTRSVGEAGVAIYSDWRFQALVLSPSPNQLLAPTAATPGVTPRPSVRPAPLTSEQIWKLDPFRRGRIVEKKLGQNLPNSFPTIDRFSDGVATSIKTLDLGAKTYQRISALKRTVTRYIDDLAGFRGAELGETRIRLADITARSLDLAVPKGIGTEAQLKALDALVQYGRKLGVQVNLVRF